jgi:hypothetical protein
VSEPGEGRGARAPGAPAEFAPELIISFKYLKIRMIIFGVSEPGNNISKKTLVLYFSHLGHRCLKINETASASTGAVSEKKNKR